MMQIKITHSLMLNQRETARTHFGEYRTDRFDVYRFESCKENFMTQETILEYSIVRVNCNPDHDW
jgi:hypothetical protein